MPSAAEYKTLLKLGLPIMVGQLGTIVTGFVDNMMVGHYSTAALAAASFCNNFFNMALLAVMGFTYGITPLVAALSARAGRESETGALMRTAARVNAVFCAAVMAVMAALDSGILTAMANNYRLNGSAASPQL